MRAVTVTNIRTGNRHFSRWATSSIAAATSVVPAGLMLGTAPA
ncbi:hypothetical protein ACIRRA_20450 [Nocardia sp. NPDC101769]